MTSELLIVAPSLTKTFPITPSEGAVTSITTLSVSISASTSSCLISWPSFLSQLESVPSNIDSGNCGDFMSIAMMIIL